MNILILQIFRNISEKKNNTRYEFNSLRFTSRLLLTTELEGNSLISSVKIYRIQDSLYVLSLSITTKHNPKDKVTHVFFKSLAYTTKTTIIHK